MRHTLLVVAFLAHLAVGLSGQTTERGVIAGTAVNQCYAPNGDGVLISVQSATTTASTRADRNGAFVFRGLPLEPFTVLGDAPGFQTVPVHDVVPTVSDDDTDLLVPVWVPGEPETFWMGDESERAAFQVVTSNVVAHVRVLNTRRIVGELGGPVLAAHEVEVISLLRKRVGSSDTQEPGRFRVFPPIDEASSATVLFRGEESPHMPGSEFVVFLDGTCRGIWELQDDLTFPVRDGVVSTEEGYGWWFPLNGLSVGEFGAELERRARDFRER